MTGSIRLGWCLFLLSSALIAAPAGAADDPEERALERKLVRLLEPLLGPGRATVSVRIERVVGSLDERRERDSDGEKVIRELKNPGGHTRRVSIAVALDRPASGAPELAELRALIERAAGLDPARGDQLVVSALPFARPAATSWLVWTSIVSILLASLLGGFAVWRRPLARGAVPSVVPELPPPPVPALAPAALDLGALAEGAPDVLQSGLAALARAQPELFAEALSLWMQEPEERR